MRRSCGIHVEHHGFHLIAHVHEFRGMLHALGPRHLADVHQAFDALLQLDEGAVVGDADDAPANVRADRDSVRAASSQGSGVSCLKPSETRCLSLSNFSTFT